MARDLKAYKQFLAYKQSVKKTSYVNLNETPRQKADRISHLLSHPVEFAQYYFPRHTKLPLAKFHKKFGEEMRDLDQGIIVKRWFRGASKSTYAMIFILMRVLAKKSKMVVYVGETKPKACKLLGRIQAHLEANDRIINDFGEQMSYGDWEGGDFTTKDGVNFMAIGKGMSPRGMINDEFRPDTIVVDDVDEEEECRSPERLDNSFEWLTGSLYGSFGSEGGLFLMLNNKIADDCLVQRISDLKSAKVDIVKVMDEKGRPTWPEKFTPEVIERIRDNMPEYMFLREYMETIIKPGKTFKKEWIQFGKVPPLSVFKNLLVSYNDPGFKNTGTADSKAVVLLGLHQGKFYVIKAFVDKASVKAMIGWNYETYNYVRSKGGVVHMFMEQVFLQDLLFKDFAEEAKIYGYPLPLTGDTRKKPDKDTRIESLSFIFEKGNVIFNEDEKDNHHMKRLIDQLLFFQKGAKKIDKDGPDALEGAREKLLNKVISEPAPVVGKHKPNAKYKVV
jgi:predicted phage terminase large subunit-like protein